MVTSRDELTKPVKRRPSKESSLARFDFVVTDSAQIPPQKCQTCHLEWPHPREVRWPQKFVLDKRLLDIKPTTPETIVLYQTWDKEGNPAIHPSVFTHFRYTHPSTNDFVRGVQYSKGTGRTSATSAIHECADLAYLRLITLNTWYWSLSANLACTSLHMMEFQSNVMLCAALVSDSALIEVLGKLRLAFIIGWLFLLSVAVVFAYREAKWDWYMKVCHTKGDLIRDCSYRSSSRTFVAMVAFEFLGIEQDVKDIPILLHPWKSVQDYSAFKCEGHRAFFVGYESKTMHRVETSRGIWCSMPPQVLTKTIVFGFKAYLTWHTMNFVFVVATLSSLFSIIMGYYKLFVIFRHRQVFKRQLITRLKNDEQGSPQYSADQRLLARHFHLEWDPKRALLKRVTLKKGGGFLVGNANVCERCGRTRELARPMGENSERDSNISKDSQAMHGSGEDILWTVTHGFSNTSRERPRPQSRSNTGRETGAARERLLKQSACDGIIPAAPEVVGSSRFPGVSTKYLSPSSESDATVLQNDIAIAMQPMENLQVPGALLGTRFVDSQSSDADASCIEASNGPKPSR